MTKLPRTLIVVARLRFVGRFDTENASKWNPAWLCRVLRWRGIVKEPRLIVAKGKVMV